MQRLLAGTIHLFFHICLTIRLLFSEKAGVSFIKHGISSSRVLRKILSYFHDFQVMKRVHGYFSGNYLSLESMQ